MSNKIMKRIAAILLICTMAISMAACGGQENPAEGSSSSSTAAATGNSTAEPVTLNLLSHRYAALEYYAQALVDEAPENVTVVPELTTYSSWQEKMRMNLSSKSSAYDITYIFPPDLAEFASNGWLLPLDDYIEKYWDEYNFGDIPQYLWDAYTYDGHIYGIPSHQWALFMFARTDLFKEAGIDIPKTLDQTIEAAKTLTKNGRSGSVLTLKASDHLAITYQAFLTACGGWWFDDNMKPAFNSKESMLAIDYMKKLIPYCPEGSTTYGSDEAMIAMAQDKAVFSFQQSTRSATMNDPEQSIVVGKVDFYPSPALKEGGAPAALFNTAGYSIPASTKNDPEVIFKTIANATDEETMNGGAQAGMPVRNACLTDELFANHPDYKASYDVIQSGARMRPAIPEFNEIMEISMQALSKVITGQADAQKEMDKAAGECEKILASAGYYK